MQTVSTPPQPQKRTELDIEKVSHPRTDPEVVTEEQLGAAPKVHNFAQSPYRRESPKVGRNELCPCGSGQKYKRCCLGKPIAPSSAAAA